MFSIGQRTYLQLRPSEAMDVTQLVEGQVQCAVDIGLTPWCGKGFLFQTTESTFKCRLSYGVCADSLTVFVQTLLRCLCRLSYGVCADSLTVFVQTLLRCLCRLSYGVCAALVCNCMHLHTCLSEPPSIGSHTIAWIPGDTAHANN